MAIGDKKPVLMQADINAPGGVAPAGYGLGGQCVDLTDYDWNNALSNGFYRGKVNTPDGKWWFGEAIAYSSDLVVQRITRQFSSIADAIVQVWAERRVLSKDSGVTYEYGPWEWVNPPMVEGVEYRTTERYNGKPVYTQLVSFGTLATNSLVDCEVSVENLSKMISVSGIWSGSTFPINDAEDNQAHLQWRNGKLLVRTVGSWGGGEGFATLKYTKTEETEA